MRSGEDTILNSADTRPSKRRVPGVAEGLDERTAAVKRLAETFKKHGSVYSENHVKPARRPMPEKVKTMLAARKAKRG